MPEGDVVLDRRLLVAEEQHFPVDPRLVKVPERVRVEETDVRTRGDLGTDGARQRFECDRTVGGLHCVRFFRGAGARCASRR